MTREIKQESSMTPLVLTALTGIINNDTFAYPIVSPTIRRASAILANNQVATIFKKLLLSEFIPKRFPSDPSFRPIELPRWAQIQVYNMAKQIPFVSDVSPESFGFVSDLFTKHIDGITGIKDNSKFIHNVELLSTYADSIATASDSSLAIGDVLSGFSSMNNLITGNVGLVTSELDKFGFDLAQTGKFISFEKLNNFGTPHAVIEALIRSNALVDLNEYFLSINFNINKMVEQMNSSKFSLKLQIQTMLYELFKTIRGDDLTLVLNKMGMLVSNIESLADLLDLKKLFPNSYRSLKVYLDGKTDFIFTSSDLVTSLAASVKSEFTGVLGYDLAKANQAFISSLKQVEHLCRLDPNDLGESIPELEEMGDQDVRTPTFDKCFINDGKFNVLDGLKSISTSTHVETLNAINEVYEKAVSSEALDDLNRIFNEIVELSKKDYPIMIEEPVPCVWDYDKDADVTVAGTIVTETVLREFCETVCEPPDSAAIDSIRVGINTYVSAVPDWHLGPSKLEWATTAADVIAKNETAVYIQNSMDIYADKIQKCQASSTGTSTGGSTGTTIDCAWISGISDVYVAGNNITSIVLKVFCDAVCGPPDQEAVTEVKNRIERYVKTNPEWNSVEPETSDWVTTSAELVARTMCNEYIVYSGRYAEELSSCNGGVLLINNKPPFAHFLNDLFYKHYCNTIQPANVIDYFKNLYEVDWSNFTISDQVVSDAVKDATELQVTGISRLCTSSGAPPPAGTDEVPSPVLAPCTWDNTISEVFVVGTDVTDHVLYTFCQLVCTAPDLDAVNQIKDAINDYVDNNADWREKNLGSVIPEIVLAKSITENYISTSGRYSNELANCELGYITGTSGVIVQDVAAEVTIEEVNDSNIITWSDALIDSDLMVELSSAIGKISSAYGVASSTASSMYTESMKLINCDIELFIECGIVHPQSDVPKEAVYNTKWGDRLTFSPRIDENGEALVIKDGIVEVPKPSIWNVTFTARHSDMVSTNFCEKILPLHCFKTESKGLIDALSLFYKGTNSSTALSASFIEGRNLDRLSKMGIGTKNKIKI